MRIQMEPTEHLVEVDGVEVRVWNGVTERGVQCFVMVHRITVRAEDGEAFEAELVERPAPHEAREVR